MNTKRISMVAVMALALVTAVVSPSLATAQSTITGKFTLPCTTYWEKATLPAGDYTFSIAPAVNDVKILHVRGPKSLDVEAWTTHDSSLKENAVELKRTGGSAVVSNMYLAAASISMHFRSSAPAKELLAAATTPPPTELAKIIVTD
jgi:hypothetical protein